MSWTHRLLAAALALHGAAAQAGVSARDDAGNTVQLAAPARRIVATAPHITELLFAAGGGARIVGTLNFSDYPPAARSIPLVGGNDQIDIERVLALKPDLLIVWSGGNTARQLEQLGRLGIPVFQSDPRRLEQVADSLTRFGRLLGSEPQAEQAAQAFRARIDELAGQYARRAPVRVFYQVWDKPLYTLNGGHIVSDVLRICGGRNVFAALAVTAPSVGIEAVLQANPEVIIDAGERVAGQSGVAAWKAYGGLLAAQRGNLFTLDGELLARAAPRLADGAAQLCQQLEAARRRRPAPAGP